MAQLEGTAPDWTVKETLDLTTAAGLDGVSRPDWYVPGRRPAGRDARPTPQLAVAFVTSYLDRLGARTAATGSVLCVGIDPDPERPAGRVSPRRSTAWSASPGCSSRRRSRTRRRSSPTSPSSRPSARRGSPRSSGCAPLVPADVPFVADAKRGDIGSTAARQAVALFDVLGADAVTVSPYLGEEAIAPLLARADRFAYVLCRTSNPGAEELQGARGGRPTRRVRASPSRCGRGSHVARAGWGPGGTVGLVVGATAPAELGRDPRAVAGPRVPGAGRRRPGRRGRARARGRPGEAPRRRRAPGRRPARQRVPRHRQGGAGRPPPRGRRTDPGERLSAAAAEWAKRLAVLP